VTFALRKSALKQALIGAGLGTVVGCGTWMATRRFGLVGRRGEGD